MIYLTESEIVYNKKVSREYYNLKVNAKDISDIARPGQFITIKVNDLDFPLIRRPMSIYKINPPFIEILYKIGGIGTQILGKRRAGENLSILGPLGNGFNLSDSFSTAILVAGGYGLSPLVALSQKLQKNKKKIIVILGARTLSLVYRKDFKEALVSTEDGSYGFKGLATDLLDKVCKKSSKEQLVIFACGPYAMLKKVNSIADKYNIKCHVSMEEILGCGLGVCLSCVCATKSQGGVNYKRICIDGPVFNSKEIKW